MSKELDNYLNFNPKTDPGGYDEAYRLRSLVDKEELKDYYKQQKDKHFIPENENIDSRKTFNSESGKYKLVTSHFKTKPGSWDYSQGKVYSNNNPEPIAVVNRNYSSFPFLFIENHPNGHDYLICGEDYQGQTIIELYTGKRVDYLPGEASMGFGFCCAEFTHFFPQNQLLLVDGCYWAAPYEYRFCDFSNPMESFKFLETEDMIDSDARKPTIEPDGTIVTYKSAYNDEDDQPGELLATTTYKRQDDELIVVSSWESNKHREQRIKNEIAQKEWEENVDNYRANDPIWLKFQELLKQEPFNPIGNYSVGITYKGWCPTWEGSEKRFCQTLHSGKHKEYSFTVEIAQETGPIKLAQSKEGKTIEPLFFEHSINGLEEMISYAKNKILKKD